LQDIIFAFVECKPNFLLWLSWLVTLCRVICRKIDIPVRTSKWPQLLIFAGACRGQKTGTVKKTCGEPLSMWAGHVSSPLHWSFFVFFPFSRYRLLNLYSQHWILVNLHASTIAFIKIWGNCLCLFYMLINTILNHFGFGYLLISSSRDNKLSLSGEILFWISGKVIWRQDLLEWAWTRKGSKLGKYCLLYSSGKILESVAKAWSQSHFHIFLRSSYIHLHQLQRVCLL